MAENFVLELASGINEPGQQQIDRFLELIKWANRLQKELAKVLKEAIEIHKEMYAGRCSREEKIEDSVIYELTTPDNKTLLVHDPFIIAPECILTVFCGENWADVTALDGSELESLSGLKISAYAICPEMNLPRKLARILCPKYERGLYKNGIENHHKCDGKCIYYSGDFDGDGWNGEGYDIDKIQLRPFRTKI